MGTNKFNFYYHKVIAIQKARKRDYDIFHWEDEAITNGLNNILNNNYEHILTDSFLDYLSHDATMGFNFEHLAEDENSVLYIIFYYIQSIVGQYTFSLDNKDSKFGFVSLLEGDIKQATHDSYQFLKLTTDYKVGNIICCILAYCYMNNNVDRFNEYYTIINILSFK